VGTRAVLPASRSLVSSGSWQHQRTMLWQYTPMGESFCGSSKICLLKGCPPVWCLQAQAEQCLNEDELRLLGSLLQEHATVVCLPAADGSETEELRINYDGFSSVRAQAPAYRPRSQPTVRLCCNPGCLCCCGDSQCDVHTQSCCSCVCLFVGDCS
jgi:hypothetical protein